jgi:hypothetical protein
MEAYRYPHYYEIALAPRAPAAELDFFEAVIIGAAIAIAAWI